MLEENDKQLLKYTIQDLAGYWIRVIFTGWEKGETR